MASMQQAKFHFEEVVQDLKLKMKEELDLITNDQIALLEDVEVSADGLVDWLIALETGLTTGRYPVPLVFPNRKEPKDLYAT